MGDGEGLLNICDEEFNKNETSNASKIIKVIGVGGGGGNAVNHMYNDDQIDHVSYLICNTDRQHLNKHNIPKKICLGEQLTKGLGAGGKPEIGKKAAQESEVIIKEALNDGTHMVFITAGMGGGTGTGAAPEVARIAKSMEILTVGIVTIPFLYEGRDKILKALDGLSEMEKNVDALLVINNERLREVYPEFSVSSAMKKADETLTRATKSITDVIIREDIMNLDFADVRTTLQDGGVAIVSQGFSTRDQGIYHAIENALKSPLLNSTNIQNASRILFHVTFSKESEPSIDQLQADISQFSNSLTTLRYGWIWGYGEDDSLGDKIKVTILASGFNINDVKSSISEEEDMKRIESYYSNVRGAESIYSRATSVILDTNELDDDDFIAFVNDTPTLRRITGAEERFRRKSHSHTANVDTNEPDDTDNGSQAAKMQDNNKEITNKNDEHNASNLREWDTENIVFGKK